ncbi:spore coat protein CotZ [Bacillus aerolatus]|uniref:Spore coat protein CotZ n=1 Tax=Bacillus aerolatus TaxID=2653354 RepID=A0A6I1FCT3_9BACI|nr:CotY/CotZ family spore coat protein [Bacillus aerolatus]KAB7705011.1 spore coat protein CotZ [Bacillus aerolatus]
MSCNKHDDDRRDRHHSGCVCEVLRAIKDLQDETMDDDCLDCKDCLIEPLGDLAGARRRNADTRVFTLSTKDGTPFFAFFDSERDHRDCRDHDHGHDHDGHDRRDRRGRDDDDACVSIFFRVEEVFNNCCARLRVLAPLDDDRDLVDITDDCCIDLRKVCKVRNFRATRSCITVDLNCFCGVQCVRDVNLRICD